jgi:hypothetical protein
MRTILISLTFLLLSAGSSQAVEEKATINDPETEIALAITDLSNIQKKLESSKHITQRLGLGPQTVSADRAFENAKSFYETKEYLSVVRELNKYLNLTQVPHVGRYLQAQYKLGHAYEELGFESKALTAYFRYLAAILTYKEANYEEMLHVMRRMLPIAAKDSGKRRSKLNELLSSITSLDLPKNIKPTVFFFAAKSATNAGNNKMASTWLETVMSEGTNPDLKARATYIKALIALSKKDYTAAENYLGEIMVIDEDQKSENRNLARLALARIAVHRKKPKLALKYYEMIPEKSEAFREALFESTYVHLDQQQDGEARTKAMLFVARYPQHADSFKLKSLLAYLDLRAGDLGNAQKGIASSNTELSSISQWMKTSLSGKSTLTHSDMRTFLQMSGPQISPTPTVQEAFSQFQRLAELKRQLEDVRGEVRNINFTLGRASLSHINPFWVNRSEQLAKIGESLLQVGHRIAASERHLYMNQLDPLAKYRLTHSEERRTRLLSAPAHSHRKMKHWTLFASFLHLTRDISNANDKLNRAKAELTAANFTLNSKSKGQGSHSSKVHKLEAEINTLNSHINRTLEILRTQKVADLLNQSPHRQMRKFMSQYSIALTEEASILQKARGAPKTTSQKILSEDARTAWKHWAHLAEETYRQLGALDTDISNSLRKLLDTLNEHDQSYQELSERGHNLTTNLEATVGQSLAAIIDQYGNAIDNKLAKNNKWKADVEWLHYTKSLDTNSNMNNKYELEKQILNDNLTDLEQGALWQWPK